MKSSIIKKSVLIFIIGLLILPSVIFAQLSPEELVKKQDIIELKEKDINFILRSLIQELTDSWIQLPEPREQAILIILKDGIKINSLEYFFLDMGGGTIKLTLELAYLLLAQDPKLYIEKFEELTVDKAKEVAMDWFLQKEIKIGKGNLDYSYATNDGWEIGVFPYIVVYKPIDSKRGEVAIGIYSSKEIDAPKVTMGLQWEGGIEELPPFIVEITGEVYKNDEIYTWTKGPEINIIFDEPVPHFDFKEPGFLEKFESSFSKLKVVIGNIFGLGAKGVKSIADTIKDTWNNIKSFVSGLGLFGASISPNIVSLDDVRAKDDIGESDLTGSEITEQNLKEDIDILWTRFSEVENITEEEHGTGGAEINEQEVQEILDDISEKIDILIQQMNDLMSEIEEENEELEITDYEDDKEDEEIVENEEIVEEEIVEEDIVISIVNISGGGGTPVSSYCPLLDMVEPTRDKVIFNEIAWMGTKGSSNDEWIELKNISDGEINLSNWQIIDKEKQIKIILTSQMNDFYLLERTNDDSVPNITADIVYAGALNNNDEVLYLFNDSCELQDMIEANPDWPAGESEEKKTMERGDDLTWHTYFGEEENGIMGTPKAENSVEPEPELEIQGCTDSIALNYNLDATIDDNSCEYEILGCTNSTALNYDASANTDDNSCNYEILGCTESLALNYNPEATTDDNSCEYLEPELEVASQEIVINEVAWMGTKASSNDEWIELYNPNDESVEILDWQLIFTSLGGDLRTTDFSIIELTTPSIDAFSYFLLERTGNETINDIDADYIYTGALNNDGGILELRDSNDSLVDKLDFSDGWLAGDKDGKITMERDGDDWRNNNLIIHNGKDADNNDVWGTPRAENSVVQETLIIGSLPFDEFDEIILEVQTGEYIIRNNISVPENKTLIIKPGVTLNFYNKSSGLSVEGTLKAIGTEDDKVTFTSLKDDPVYGSWDKLSFTPTSVNSELNYIILEYAGGGYGTPCSPEMAGIKVDRSLISLSNSIIRNNRYDGIRLINSSSIIDNVQFIDNIACESLPNRYGGAALLVNGGSPTIKNSLFKGSRYGIRVSNSASPVIENNVFEENEEAVYVLDSHPSLNGNIAINNDINGIVVRGNITEDVTWRADLPYVLQGNVNGFPDVTITLEPGTVIKYYTRYSAFSINGILKAIGVENNKIVFTSLKDDEYGGDTNNDGNNTFPGIGDWDKISFSSTSIGSELDHIILKYAGGHHGTPCSPDMMGIEVDQTSISLSNSIIENNRYHGIKLVGSSSVIDNVQFINNIACQSSDNSYGGVAISIYEGNPTIRNSSFKKSKRAIYISNNGDPILENLTFGIGDNANVCNIFENNKCINPLPEPDLD